MPLTLSGDGSIGPLSATEVGYLDGVTSEVQTQLNTKASSASAILTGSPTIDGHPIPYRFAAGTVSATSAGTTVTFPANRFTQAPIVTIGPAWVAANGALGNSIIIDYPGETTTSVILRSSTASAVVARWMAVQMTSSSSSG